MTKVSKVLLVFLGTALRHEGTTLEDRFPWTKLAN